MSNGQQSYCARYKITSDTLKTRLEFIGVGSQERQEMENLIPWARAVAPAVAAEFYDFQFEFPATRRFFEGMAQKKGITIDDLRRALETAQVGYINQIFDGARTGWGPDYFESRMSIGQTHDRIDLPFKWYIGSYTSMYDILAKYMKAKIKNKKVVDSSLRSLRKIMNYDMQAVGDSFLLGTLESLGLDVQGVQTNPGQDATEFIGSVKEQVKSILDQADALSHKRINDPSLANVVPGRIGKAMAGIVKNMRVFLDEVTASTQSVNNVAQDLSALTEQLSSNAQLTQEQAEHVSQAVSDKTAVEQSVAAGSIEMTESITEISKNACDGAQVAGRAVGVAEATAQQVSKLNDSSVEIGKVVKLISSIAAQTNLLALNATIEAARAGEAGKGFAVVATEVKELAKETSIATEEIGRNVESIQADTRQSVDAITEISTIIGQLDDIQNNIAAAVEEQTATTNDMSRSIGDSADRSSEMERGIQQVTQAAVDTSKHLGEAQQKAEELSSLADNLLSLVNQYK